MKDFFNQSPQDAQDHIYKSSLVWLAAIIVFCQQMWVPGFFHDGYLYAALGKNALEQGHWWLSYLSETNYPVYNQHPPLTFILEGFFYKVFGTSWTSARLFNCILSVLMVGLLMEFIKKHAAKSWGFFAGTILVLMPPMFKNARFPNTDIPLCFFILLGLIFYYHAYLECDSEAKSQGQPTRKKRYWALTGICFGLALLTKGPAALVLAFTIVIHLLLMKRLRFLKSPWPWVFFLLGIGIFSLWPLILWSKGVYFHFWGYVDTQILGTVVDGRGRPDLALWEYPYYLIKKAAPWFILSLLGLYQIFKNRQQNPLGVLFACLFLCVLIPFSFVRWKYAHYLLPCYPGLAAVAAYPLYQFSRSFHQIYSTIFKKLMVILALVLLVFPVTTEIRRDKEIFTLLDILKNLPQRPTDWILLHDVYPYYSLVNLMSWTKYGEVHMSDMDYIEKHLRKEHDQINQNKRMVVLLKKEDVLNLEEKYPQSFAENFSKLAYFSQRNMMVLISASLFNDKDKGKTFLNIE